MTLEQLLASRARKLAQGLLGIARLTMPDSFLATDSRVILAKDTLRMLRSKKVKRGKK